MKVLALNSSLRQDGERRTELMLNHLVKGMREAGAEVEVLNLRDKPIHYCMGCFSCDTITPGQCIIQDDMAQELYPKWLASDLCIYRHFSLPLDSECPHESLHRAHLASDAAFLRPERRRQMGPPDTPRVPKSGRSIGGRLHRALDIPISLQLCQLPVRQERKAGG